MNDVIADTFLRILDLVDAEVMYLEERPYLRGYVAYAVTGRDIAGYSYSYLIGGIGGDSERVSLEIRKLGNGNYSFSSFRDIDVYKFRDVVVHEDFVWKT